MRLTDKQCAVILIRNWLYGRTDPLFMDAEEISSILDFDKAISDKRREKILKQVKKIRGPFEERIENLYSNINGWS